MVRADASPTIGTGHVMRSLTLARAWRDSGGEVLFACSEEGASLADQVRMAGLRVEILPIRAGIEPDAQRTASLAQTSHACFTVIDGYHFDAAYRQILKADGIRVLSIDDCAQPGMGWADIILNQNIFASREMYSEAPAGTTLLLGTKYALLRPEFLAYQSWRRAFPARARNVLMTLGGSDPSRLTVRSAKILCQISGITLRVVVGPAVQNRESIVQQLSQYANVEVLVEPGNMAKLMAWADVALSAAGSTCWELAFMGLPSVVVVIADNQRPIAEGLMLAGAVFNHWWHEQLTDADLLNTVTKLVEDMSLRRRVSANAAALVDGYGSRRVVEAISRAGVC